RRALGRAPPRGAQRGRVGAVRPSPPRRRPAPRRAPEVDPPPRGTPVLPLPCPVPHPVAARHRPRHAPGPAEHLPGRAPPRQAHQRARRGLRDEVGGQVRDLPAGVKETTGGAFDPEAPTQYFIASNPSQILRVPHEYVLVAVNELDPPTQRETLARILDTGKKVFLDSGIFNLAMSHARKHDVTHDVGLSMPPEEIDGFNQLWDLYGTIATTYGDRIWGIVELD